MNDFKKGDYIAVREKEVNNWTIRQFSHNLDDSRVACLTNDKSFCTAWPFFRSLDSFNEAQPIEEPSPWDSLCDFPDTNSGQPEESVNNWIYETKCRKCGSVHVMQTRKKEAEFMVMLENLTVNVEQYTCECTPKGLTFQDIVGHAEI